ncbi:MAG: hypothetical protein AVDCRST_MAG93-7904, partial [uncultured Chloroflexia bacterium]
GSRHQHVHAQSRERWTRQGGAHAHSRVGGARAIPSGYKRARRTAELLAGDAV